MVFVGFTGAELFTVPMFLIGTGVSIIEFLFVLSCLVMNKPYDHCLTITSIEKNTTKQPHKIFLGLLRLVLNAFIIFLQAVYYIYTEAPVHWFLFLFCFFISIYVWMMKWYFTKNAPD